VIDIKPVLTRPTTLGCIQQMRILFLAGRDIKHPSVGGGDIQAWEWARYLVSQGHEVTYICSAHPSLKASEEAAGVRIRRLGTGAILPLRAFLFYRRHKKEFDLVYEDVIGGSRLPFLSPLYVTQPVVVAWHQVTRQLFYENFARPLAFVMTRLERALARVFKKAQIRAPSSDTKVELHRELGLPLENIWVIPASIPDEWLAIEPQKSKRESSIVYLGNIRKYKGVHVLIQALPFVLRQCEDVRLTIAGRGVDPGYLQTLHQLASDLNITKCVDFRLDISEKEKKSLLYASKALVLPSRLEGFGIVVLEANAYGVPVVASSGVPEDAVKDGLNGLRTPYGDVPALADAITRLLTDDELHARLSYNSALFVQQFAWHKVGAQFEEVLKGALERKAQPLTVGK